MKFPNAAKGVKKIYVAEILGLIGSLAALVSAVSLLVAVISGGVSIENLMNENEVKNVLSAVIGSGLGGFISFLISGAVSFVLSAIAFIMRLVGVVQAKRDEENFGTALVFIIIGIVCTLLTTIFNNISGVVSGFANTVTDLMGVLATIFIVSGIIKLADQLNNGVVAKKGVTILKLIIFVNALSLIGNLVVSFMGGITITAGIAAAVIGVIVAVLSVVEYILYLIFLSRANKMLAKS